MANHNDVVFDYIVVGGGPSGLAFTQIVSKLNKKIILIEADSMLGGCHAVKRRDGFFTEHGPRIYSNRFKSFQNLICDMGSTFDKLFVPTRGSSLSLYITFIKKFRICEILAFFLIGFLILIGLIFVIALFTIIAVIGVIRQIQAKKAANPKVD